MLDIYAIEELRNKKVPATDDSPKYKYTSDEKGNYGTKALNTHAHTLGVTFVSSGRSRSPVDVQSSSSPQPRCSLCAATVPSAMK